jgi:D-alanyl-D-alanine carboxypeptidase
MQDQMGYPNMANHPLQPLIENMQNSNNEIAQVLAALINKMNQPKTVIRDANGKIVGVANGE